MITISRSSWLNLLALHCVLSNLNPEQLLCDGITLQDVSDVRRILSNARASR